MWLKEPVYPPSYFFRLIKPHRQTNPATSILVTGFVDQAEIVHRSLDISLSCNSYRLAISCTKTHQSQYFESSC
ncbi:hypothetical protein PtA15_8A148 [Puccinia triticina]|uniref:Uncharacterized protein n=1 Tax=Puccinia triticina TaxID=208348 RepID=A0ABY7CTZ0_9BASI|nr:uncharacterized protein PtA15_8A148 [Puccinia triticina]WAQ87245.1 hypothetical protein PtA15_8A148 [Puccinia triticina]